MRSMILSERRLNDKFGGFFKIHQHHTTSKPYLIMLLKEIYIAKTSYIVMMMPIDYDIYCRHQRMP